MVTLFHTTKIWQCRTVPSTYWIILARANCRSVYSTLPLVIQLFLSDYTNESRSPPAGWVLAQPARANLGSWHTELDFRWVKSKQKKSGWSFSRLLQNMVHSSDDHYNKTTSQSFSMSFRAPRRRKFDCCPGPCQVAAGCDVIADSKMASFVLDSAELLEVDGAPRWVWRYIILNHIFLGNPKRR